MFIYLFNKNSLVSVHSRACSGGKLVKNVGYNIWLHRMISNIVITHDSLFLKIIWNDTYTLISKIIYFRDTLTIWVKLGKKYLYHSWKSSLCQPYCSPRRDITMQCNQANRKSGVSLINEYYANQLQFDTNLLSFHFIYFHFLQGELQHKWGEYRTLTGLAC